MTTKGSHRSRVPTPKAEHAPTCLRTKKCVCDKEEVDRLLREWWDVYHLDIADDIGIEYGHVSHPRTAEVFP